jgi:hypothetical protein
MRRGQAFEVFRLLIAAVVAMVILMVLFNVLNLVRPPGTSAKEAVKNLIESYIETGGGNGAEVEFQKGELVSISGIAMDLGYSSDYVCVANSIPDAGINNSLCGNEFTCDNTNKYIRYDGTKRRRKARVYVYCAEGECTKTKGRVECAVTVTP